MRDKEVTGLLGQDRAQPLLLATRSFYGSAEQGQETLHTYLRQLPVIHPAKPSVRQVQTWYEVQRTMHERRKTTHTPHVPLILRLALDELFDRN